MVQKANSKAPISETNLAPKASLPASETKSEKPETPKLETSPSPEDVPLPISQTKLKRSAKPVASLPMLNLFSIQESLESQDEISESPIQSLKRPSQHFSQTDLDSEWQLFLKQLKSKDSLKHMLIQNVLLKKQNEIVVEVEVASEVIRDEFLQVKTEFFNHFAHKVNNHCIEINFKFNESLMVETPNKRKLFDKFALLNPTLLDLDKLLKLDFS